MTGRCLLCREPLPGDRYCANFVECNYRARLRLEIPEWQARMWRGRDLHQYERKHGGRR